jgi:predicted SprT family Zn-dependent metalloprotease
MRTRPPTPLTERARAARNLALSLMARHGLRGWEFGFNRRKRQLGICYDPHRGLPGRIELSIYFVEKNPDEEIRDTILHEIAHALVGTHHGHDEVWQAKCLEIGATPKRCGKAVMPLGPWRAACPGCRARFHRHRRPKPLRGFFCSSCGPRDGGLLWRKAG